MQTRLITCSLAMAATLCATPAFAGSATLTLSRVNLTNVNDSAGTWQHDAGDVLRSGVKVGQYAMTRRVTTGGTGSPLNTAATTITLFLATASGTAPQNITMQGAHDFTAGNFRGSVSAASNRYSWIQGGDAVYASAGAGTLTLSIAWAGAAQLTLP